ncbi:dihydroorotase [Bombiscardovia nodaiensis]|uniref:Dihydroorotase n=1 Tax=Bombiscardovia nodaiensis TaxID=2932181 RepID=A0ABM8B8E0_9BIFI|nr:dihydroorotase [Bombiscardovia nodaiensis]
MGRADTHPTLTLRRLRLWKSGQLVDLRLPWPTPDTIRQLGSLLNGWEQLAQREQTSHFEVDMEGALLAPGLVDPHVHFRDPGQTQKEDMLTGCCAAAAGGYTSVLIMPNTQPAMDNPDTVDFLQDYERRRGCRLPVGYRLCLAASQAREGKQPTSADLWTRYMPGGPAAHRTLAARLHPVVAVSDDGAAVADGIAQAVAEQAAQVGLPVLDHCEHHVRGQVNAGPVAEALGLEGVPVATELRIVQRDIELARSTGAHFHLQHVSTAAAFSAIRQAKAQGLPVTCETAPHYLALCDEDLLERGAMAKMNPPLRSRSDRQATLEAVADGTVDMIATDHAPHTASEKERGLASAPNGIIGLETAYGVCHRALVDAGWISGRRLIELMSLAPARLMGEPTTDPEVLLQQERQAQGAQESTAGRPLIDVKAADQPVNWCLLVPEESWVVDASRFHSKARNTPFQSERLTGRVVMTIVDSQPVFSSVPTRFFQAHSSDQQQAIA